MVTQRKGGALTPSTPADPKLMLLEASAYGITIAFYYTSVGLTHYF